LGAVLVAGVCLASIEARAQEATIQAAETNRQLEEQRRIRQLNEMRNRAPASVRRSQVSASQRARQRALSVTNRPPRLEPRPAYGEPRRVRPIGTTGPRGRFRPRAQSFSRVIPSQATSITVGADNLQIQFRPPP